MNALLDIDLWAVKLIEGFFFGIGLALAFIFLSFLGVL